MVFWSYSNDPCLSPWVLRPTTVMLKHPKSHLWEAANIQRVWAVDRTHWRGFILPTLFFMRTARSGMTSRRKLLTCVAKKTLYLPQRFTDSKYPNVVNGEPSKRDPQRQYPLPIRMQEVERVNHQTLYRIFGSADWDKKVTLGTGDAKRCRSRWWRWGAGGARCGFVARSKLGGRSVNWGSWDR